MADQVPVLARDYGGSDPGKPAAEGDGEGVGSEEEGPGFGVELTADSEEGGMRGIGFWFVFSGVLGLIGEDSERFECGGEGLVWGLVSLS